MAAKIGEIKYEQGGMVADLKLDKKTKKFSAEWMGQTYEDVDGQALERRIKDLMREAAINQTWIPLIRIALTSESRRDDSAYLGYRVERIYACQRMDGSWVRVEWDVEPDRRNERPLTFNDLKGPVTFPFRYEPEHSYQTSPALYLPYDGGTWDKLYYLLQRIHVVNASINEYLRLGFVPSELKVADPRKEVA